eukprot:6652967-Pyramimonas_sp.AAC.1
MMARLLDALLVLPDALRVDLVERLEDELHKGALPPPGGRLLAEAARRLVVVHVPPQPRGEVVHRHPHPVHVAVQLRERPQREAPPARPAPIINC